MDKMLGPKLNTKTRKCLYIGTFIIVLLSLAANLWSAYQVAVLKPGQTVTTLATGEVKKPERQLAHARRVANTNEIVLEYSDGTTEKIDAPDIKIVNGRNGDDGRDGSKGDKGDKGDRGERGPAGKDGYNGTNGKDGASGKDGKDGVNGAQGPKGDKGDPGKDGINGTIIRCQNRSATEADFLVSDNGGTTWKKLITLQGQCG